MFMTPVLSFGRHRDRVRLIADDADADLRRVSPETKLWRASGAAAHRSRLKAIQSSDAACRPPTSRT
jgi:hypothetical protein